MCDPAKTKRRKLIIRPTPRKTRQANESDNIAENAERGGYIALVRIFDHLGVADLLRASMVSKLWYFVANHNIYWNKVKLSKCNVVDCNPFADKLNKHNTRDLHLDLSITNYKLSSTVNHLGEKLNCVSSLRKLTITTAFISSLQLIVEFLPQLESLCVPVVIGHVLDLEPVTKNLVNLVEFELISIYNPLNFIGAVTIRNLTNLKKVAFSFLSHNSLGILLVNFPEGMTSMKLDFGNVSLDVRLLSRFRQLKEIDFSEVILRNVPYFQVFTELRCLKLTSKYFLNCASLLRHVPQTLQHLEACTSEIAPARREVDLALLSRLRYLKTLKLFGPRAYILARNAKSLKSLTYLKVLSLEGVMNLETVVIHLPLNLVSLTLSDSLSLPDEFPAIILPKLVSLNSLKLYSIRCETFKRRIKTVASKIRGLKKIDIF